MCTRQTRKDHHRKQLVLRAVVAILIATLAVSAIAQKVDADDLPTVVVRVDNLAAVSAEILQFAEARAADVFAQAGVDVQWMDEDSTVRDRIRPPFTIVLARGDKNARSLGLKVEALGGADLRVRRAYVFYDRIEALNARSLRGPASVLGDVMAHELGHLLLSPPGHSVDGIMRSSVETRLRPLDTFTPAQAREILFHVRQLPLMQTDEAFAEDHGL